VHADMAFDLWGGHAYDLNQPHVFLGGFLCGPAGLAALARGYPVLRDDRPIVEYLTTGTVRAGLDERPIIELLARHADPLASVLAAPLPEDTLAMVARVRERNLGHMVCLALLGDLEDQAGRPGYDPMALVTAALQANPDNAKANRIMGDMLAYAGRWADAERSYLRAIELRDEDALAHLGLGRALWRRGDAGGAAAQLERARVLGSEDESLPRELEQARRAAMGSPR